MIVEPSLLDHPKYLRLHRRLGEQALHVLFRLWAHCQAEQRGEKWRGADAEYVESVVRWNGALGECVKHLSDCGFIEIRDGCVVVHDWSKHNRSLINSWRVGRFGGRPRKQKHEPTGNPRETHGFAESGVSVTRGKPVGPQRREEKRREEKTSSSPTPSHVPTPLDAVVESSVPSGSFSDSERTQIEAVWAIWPKRIDTLPGQVAIGHAIRRHGLDSVLEGTRKIVAADAETKSTPPGRYLPKPSEFFANSRYLDDPAQYGPRQGVVDMASTRALVKELESQVALHPGNPGNTEGSMDRKKEAAGEFGELVARLNAARQQLNNAVEVGR